jgi:nifR3 family TIM-barrel protein
MRIGNIHLNNRYFLAPLAGVSNLPFRLINKDFGCALVYTEMISAEGLVRDSKRTKAFLISDEREKPVAYQMFGSNPESLKVAAKILADYGADIIDLNMGCPVKKVIKNGAGCALLSEPEKVRNILSSIRKSINIPLTIKIRLGMNPGDLSYLKIAEIAQDEGVDAICLHPRTKNQQFKGDIDLDALKRLKESVTVPVIGSGNLFNVNDVKNMFKKTGCDAVMIARGAFGNPFIFKDIIDNLSPDPYKSDVLKSKEQSSFLSDEALHRQRKLQIKEVILKHVEYFLEYYPAHVCHKEMKKHMIWYTKGFEGSADFRKKVVVTNDLDEMLLVVEDFFAA